MKLLKMAVCLVFLFTLALPINIGTASAQKLKQEFVNLDFVEFAYSEGVSLVEALFSINRDAELFKPAQGGYSQKVEVYNEFLQNGTVVMSDTVVIEDHVKNLNEVNASQKLLEIKKYMFQNGDYIVRSTFVDKGSNTFITFKSALHFKGFKTGEMQLSGILLANNITRAAGEPDMFYRNGLRVLPNPSLIYGRGLPVLKYYAEAYYIEFSDELKEKPFIVRSKVIDLEGNLIKTLPEKQKPRIGSSVVIADGFNVMGLKDGFYYLNLEIYDPVTETTAVQTKRFLVLKKLATDSPSAAFLEQYDTIPIETIEKEFEYAYFIANKNERNLFKNLDDQGKRKFMKAFWERKDPGCKDKGFQFRENFIKRVMKAAKLYSKPQRPGWKSDRGRILIKYGEPDQIENYQSTMDENAHQIWFYHELMGGVEFYFVDKYNVQKFDLVHSTHPKELQDYQWKRWLNR